MKTKTNKKKEKGGYFLKKQPAAFLLGILVQMMIVSAVFAQQETIPISGKVIDESGEPMIGVNIVVKNTTNGTITDIDGNFTMKVKPADTLQISFIGYDIEYIPVKGKRTFNITMQSNTTDLNEVVVVGYGEVKRANLTGSIASMSSKEIEDIPVTSMSNLLEGRLAGVSVSPAQPTGNPGAATRIKIRTETTFGSSGQTSKDPAPLYIVDGFEVTQEEFDVLDPSEIDSYSVLKDASAAVYGSKGANGVVLVKTKRGKEGKLQVNYSGSYGIMDATMQTEMMSAYDHARTLNARYLDDPNFTQISENELEAMKSLNNDWLPMAWQRSSISRHTINISGGSSKVKYFAGGTYVYTEGNFPELGVGKYSYRLGLDANITDDLMVSATVSIDSRDFKRPYISGAGSNTLEDLFQELLQAPKWTPPYINGYPVSNNLDFNPLYMFETKSYKRSVDKGNTLNLKVSYNIPKVKGLVASASYSRRESHGYGKDYLIPYTLYEFEPQDQYQYILSDVIKKEVTIQNNNRISEAYDFSQNYQLNLSLNYSNTFGKHSVSSFLTYEQSEGNAYGFKAIAENIETYGIENQNAFQTKSTSGSRSENGDLGAVFRLNYSYADRYLFESTLRYETTTLFAPGERSGLFPSASFGWIASEENFFKNKLSFLNFFKLRYSIGLTGYSSVSPYEYTLKYLLSSGRYLFGSNSPSAELGIGGKTDVASTGVSWEKSLMQNFGIDAKFLDNRLSVTLDGYYTYQYDILDKRTATFPETAGLGDMPGENVGRLEAWGYDMSIGYRGKINRDISYDINGIFSFGTNRILERPTEYSPLDFRYPIGKSTSAYGREEGYITKGIIRTQEQLDAINAEWMSRWGHGYTIEGTPAEVGSLYFQDIGRPGNLSNGESETVFEPDGEISSVYDRTYVERVNDHFVWKNLLPTSISLGAGWKDLRVSLLFTMSYGISNQAVDKLARTVADKQTNAPAFWSNFWTPDNTNAAYPSPKFSTTNQWVSTFWMKDVYQVRLKNLNISYSIPAKISSQWHIPELRIFFAGTNLWSPVKTFKYKEDAIARFNTYPLLKTFSLGLNIKI